MAVPTTAVNICNIALGLIGHSVAITSLTADATKEDRMCNRFYSTVLQQMLELFAWHTQVEHRPLVLTAGFAEYNSAFGTSAKTITGITQANPAVVTSAAHGYSTGHYIQPSSVTGMTEVNGNVYHVTNVDANSFQLTGINSTDFTAYSSGGTVVRKQPQVKWADAYTYDVPSDFLLAVSLEDTDAEFEVLVQAGSTELVSLEENAILTYIKTMSDDSDVSGFRQLFLNAFAHRLAMMLAPSILGAKTANAIMPNLQALYNIALGEAEASAARSERVKADTSDTWVDTRQ